MYCSLTSFPHRWELQFGEAPIGLTPGRCRAQSEAQGWILDHGPCVQTLYHKLMYLLKGT